MIGMRDIELLKNGDLEAFERVYRAFWNKVYQFSGLFIDDDFEREDIVQEVFLRIWNKRNLIDSGKDFNGFLFITTRNIVFNRLRTIDRKERIEKVAEKIGLEYSPDVESNIDADFYKKKYRQTHRTASRTPTRGFLPEPEGKFANQKDC